MASRRPDQTLSDAERSSPAATYKTSQLCDVKVELWFPEAASSQQLISGSQEQINSVF